MIETIRTMYQRMLDQYGLSSTSNKKFREIQDLFSEHYNLPPDQVYATSSGTRPGNLEVRLSQGQQATKHTDLALTFIKDDKNTVENRDKLTNSSFVTLARSLNRGKAGYDVILIFIDSEESLYLNGAIYSANSELAQRIFADFEIPMKHEVTMSNEVEGRELVNETGMENVILFGPPGTSKTWTLQHKYITNLANSEVVTFHQSYSYEEFVEGIKPIISKTRLVGSSSSASTETPSQLEYEYARGVFYASCEKAAVLAGYSNLQECLQSTKEDRNQKFKTAIENQNIYTLCIDEINRANIAGVFGDLISLIELSKRLGNSDELIVKLPYSKTDFGVPSNLRIVGTMNTADRSITLLDSALRRRFSFVEMPPRYDLIGSIMSNGVEINFSKLLFTINKRIQYFLGKDFCIGHTYFLGLNTKKEGLNVLVNKIVPLLEEYFYNDYLKIKLVLGEKKNSTNGFFIQDQDANISNLFPFYVEDEIEEKTIFIKNEEILSLLEDDKTESDIDESIFTNIYA